MLVAMRSVPEEHRHVVRALSRELEAGVDQLVDDMFEVLASDAALRPLLTPEHLEIGRSVARTDLLDEVHALGRGGELPTGCPPAVAETARSTAELGVPVTVPIQCYRAGHRVLWRACRASLLRDAAPEALVEVVDDFLFAYADRCCALLLGAFEQYREETLRSREHAQLLEVRALLAGAAATAATVDYPLSATHVAWVAVARDREPPGRPAPTGAGAPLIVRLDAATAWGWVPGEPPRFDATRDAHVGVGAPGRGLEGFRRSHRQAQRALEVALRGSPSVRHYEDVALEGLPGAGRQATEDFVAHELRGLDAPRRARAPLRETLLAYFAEGDSLAATARRLGVHERTVAYRLGVAEERLGRRVASRRAELETALRLERLAGLAAEGRPGAAPRGS
jgi:hypothetical protein